MLGESPGGPYAPMTISFAPMPAGKVIDSSDLLGLRDVSQFGFSELPVFGRTERLKGIGSYMWLVLFTVNGRDSFELRRIQGTCFPVIIIGNEFVISEFMRPPGAPKGVL